LENLEWVTHRENIHHMLQLHPHMNVGEENGRAKLTEDKVRAIRARYASGGVTHRELAEDFAIGCSHMSNVINRKAWRHVK
jgi:hypothetical protein